jgi:hypothetical protein
LFLVEVIVPKVACGSHADLQAVSPGNMEILSESHARRRESCAVKSSAPRMAPPSSRDFENV